jgi:hypothetical protein
VKDALMKVTTNQNTMSAVVNSLIGLERTTKVTLSMSNGDIVDVFEPVTAGADCMAFNSSANPKSPVVVVRWAAVEYITIEGVN